MLSEASATLVALHFDNTRTPWIWSHIFVYTNSSSSFSFSNGSLRMSRALSKCQGAFYKTHFKFASVPKLKRMVLGETWAKSRLPCGFQKKVMRSFKKFNRTGLAVRNFSKRLNRAYSLPFRIRSSWRLTISSSLDRETLCNFFDHIFHGGKDWYPPEVWEKTL